MTRQDHAGAADAPRPEVERVHAILRAAGQERFAARAQRWEGEFAARTSEDCVLEGLLRAVGLGRNAEACLALASALDGTTLEALLDGAGEQRRTVATAVLLGMAGLLEEARADDETRHAWALYRDHWPGRPLNARQWQRFRLRPANLPEARLVPRRSCWQRAGCAAFWTVSWSRWKGSRHPPGNAPRGAERQWGADGAELGAGGMDQCIAAVAGRLRTRHAPRRHVGCRRWALCVVAWRRREPYVGGDDHYRRTDDGATLSRRTARAAAALVPPLRQAGVRGLPIGVAMTHRKPPNPTPRCGRPRE